MDSQIGDDGNYVLKSEVVYRNGKPFLVEYMESNDFNSNHSNSNNNNSNGENQLLVIKESKSSSNSDLNNETVSKVDVSNISNTLKLENNENADDNVQRLALEEAVDLILERRDNQTDEKNNGNNQAINLNRNIFQQRPLPLIGRVRGILGFNRNFNNNDNDNIVNNPVDNLNNNVNNNQNENNGNNPVFDLRNIFNHPEFMPVVTTLFKLALVMYLFGPDSSIKMGFIYGILCAAYLHLHFNNQVFIPQWMVNGIHGIFGQNKEEQNANNDNVETTDDSKKWAAFNNGFATHLIEKDDDDEVVKLYKRLVNNESSTIPITANVKELHKFLIKPKGPTNDETINTVINDNDDNDSFNNIPEDLKRAQKWISFYNKKYPDFEFQQKSFFKLVKDSFSKTDYINRIYGSNFVSTLFYRFIALVCDTFIISPLRIIFSIPILLSDNDSAKYYGEIIWQFFASLIPELPIDGFENIDDDEI